LVNIRINIETNYYAFYVKSKAPTVEIKY